MSNQDDRARDAFRESRPPDVRVPAELEIPLGTAFPHKQGGVERLVARCIRWVAGIMVTGVRLTPLALLGILLVAGGLAHTFNVMVICRNYEPRSGTFPDCRLGLGWPGEAGPTAYGMNAFGPALVFMGTTLWAVGYARALRRKLDLNEDGPSEPARGDGEAAWYEAEQAVVLPVHPVPALAASPEVRVIASPPR